MVRPGGQNFGSEAERQMDEKFMKVYESTGSIIQYTIYNA